MKNILVVCGTRPDTIKLIPLIRELRASSEFEVSVCISGQHRASVDEILSDEDIIADYDLNISKPDQDLFDITTAVLSKLKTLLLEIAPELVIVHGDTSTALAAALACFYLKIKLAHVEAGLRTNDMSSPFPEEFNRRTISTIASYHFAPTVKAYNTLINEGVQESTVFMCGNTIVDSILSDLSKSETALGLDLPQDKKIITVTLHRREGRPHLKSILNSVRSCIERHRDVIAVLPLHPNPRLQEEIRSYIGDCEQFILTHPLDRASFRRLLLSSFLVVTDSGGVQEEAAILGIPTVIARDTTERTELVENGHAILASTSPENISSAISSLLTDFNLYSKMSRKATYYGDGSASRNIVEILKTIL